MATYKVAEPTPLGRNSRGSTSVRGDIMALIEVTGLTKIFYVPQKRPGLVGSVEYLFNPQRLKKVAVDHINLSMEAGESVAYVGPNGAGKSTTIKMLTGILIPTYLNVLKLALSISPSLHFSID